MIKNQWYAVLDSKEVKKGKITTAKRLGKELLFWRKENNEVACLERKCAHRSVDIGIGKLVNDHVQCPFHGLEYDSSGKCVLIPANGRVTQVPEKFKVNNYAVGEHFGMIFIWNGDPNGNLPKIPFLDGLDNSFVYSTFIDPWPVDYSRSAENQLDVAHLPFVHHNTIGRGGNTIVNGPIVEIDGEVIDFWTRNSKDDGNIIPESPDDMKKSEARGHLQFVFPNLWQNILNDKIRIFAAFVPVDDENSVVYIRFCQKVLKIPVLKQFMLASGYIFSRIVLSQDKRVVITQQPKKTSYKMDENLFKADLPIIFYRRRRDELKKKNN